MTNDHPFMSEVQAAAAKYGLDPALVAAICANESAWHPQAVRYESHVGKYVQDPAKHRPMGCSEETERRLQMMSFSLMQVMGFNIRAMGFGGWLTDYLDPVKGLDIGCKFLAGLFKRWSKVEDVVSAYNQGSPRRGQDGKYSNQPYVDHVMASYRQYGGDRRPAPDVTNAPTVSPYKFSAVSLAKLKTCDDRLQLLMATALTRDDCPMDFTVLEGHRGQAAQDAAYQRRASKVKWPNGKHNTLPSKAVDVAPYPVVWTDLNRFKVLAEHIKKVADDLGIKVEWGGDWTSFKDYPHWQVD